MKDFNRLKDYVKKKGYGTALYGNVNAEEVYLSRGIREVFFEGDDIQIIIGDVMRFQKKDFGDAAEHGRKQTPGHEYGRYETSLTCDDDDTAVWIHRDGSAIIVYFAFER